MSRPAHDRFERLIAEHYESLKPEVLHTVRGKLGAHSLHPDQSDLEAAYNSAWHALYEQSRRNDKEVSNLGGWLAMITYRRAIDDVRSSRLKYRAPVGVGESVSGLGYERDVDAELTDRQRYHQWLMSVRLRLNAREQQAVSLCVLHEHSRRDASDIMGIDIKRLDKIMVAANKKLGGLLEAINRGDWCEDQRSLTRRTRWGCTRRAANATSSPSRMSWSARRAPPTCAPCAASRSSCRRPHCWRAPWQPAAASSAG